MEYIRYTEKDPQSYIKEYVVDEVCVPHLNISYDHKSEKNKLDVYLPLTGKKPYPVIVYVHGGGLVQGDKTRHINPMLQGLRYGYAVACINYRLADEATYPAMIYDVSNAVKYLKVHSEEYFINPDKLVLWGETHGAYLCCLMGIYGGTGKVDDPESPYPDVDSSVAGVVDYWAFTDFELTYSQVKKAREEKPETPCLEEQIFGASGEELEQKIKASIKPLDGIRDHLPPWYILIDSSD